MKIGILTFHRALNYGAVLQCFALQEALKNLGHDVKIIDYRPPYLESYRNGLSYYAFSKANGLIQKVKYLLVGILMHRKKRKSSKVFDSFLKEFFVLDSNYRSIISEIKGYDAIVFGSDQIWSPSICDGFDRIYWGDFLHQNTLLVTYAASMGGHNKIEDKQVNEIRRLINNYNAVSVRETQLQTFLLEKIGIRVPVVCDPTILVNRSVFDTIAKRRRSDRYVLFFALEYDQDSIAFAKNVAKQLNAKVVRVGAIAELYGKDPSIEYEEAVSPAEFCGLIKYAECVVTISFHGTVFSTIFKKDFYSLECSQGDRARDFLESVGLSERMVNAKASVVFSKVDYSNFDNNINILRQPSIEYIKSVL